MKKIRLCVLALICLLACEERDEIVINNLPVAEEPQDTTGDPDPPAFRCYKPDSTAEIIEGTFMEAAFDYVHNRLLIALRNPNRVLIYDLEANQKHEIQLSEIPIKLAVIPMGTAFAVAGSNAIYHYNLNTRVLRGTYPIQGQPRSLVFSDYVWIYYNNNWDVNSIDVRNQQTYSLRVSETGPVFLGSDQNALYVTGTDKIEKVSIQQGSQPTTDTIFNLNSRELYGRYFQPYDREYLINASAYMIDLADTDKNVPELGPFSHSNLTLSLRAFSSNDSLNQYYMVGRDEHNYADTLINVFTNFQYQRAVRIPRIQHQGNCYIQRARAIFYYGKANQILAITQSDGRNHNQDLFALLRIDL